ncbi:MAG: TetR family transcriptional regulator [Microbacteriaceae bacterium]
MSEADSGSGTGRGRKRQRGRPRADAAVDTKKRITRAAAAEFADRGYEAASLRSIARRAGVDPALVHHYFEDKADLFTTTVGAPIRPDRLLSVILAGPHEQIGEGLVRYLLGSLVDPTAQTRIVALLRTAIGHNPASGLLKEFLIREVMLRLASATTDENAELRANLAASQVAGLLMLRYVLRVEPLASAPIDEVAARVGPVIQWQLFGTALIRPDADTRPLDSEGLVGE